MALPGHAQVYYLLSDNIPVARTDQLRRVDADGIGGDVQIATNFADSPRSIVIDNASNRAFVAEARARTAISACIYSVSLATGASSTFVSSLSIVSGMTIDATNNYLCYLLSDSQPTTSVDELHRVNLDGSNDVLIGTGYVNSPGPISLDVQSNRLFMSDLRAQAPKIVALNLASPASATTIVTIAANSGASGIGVDTKAGKLYYVITDNVPADASQDQLRRINLNGTSDEQVAIGFVNAPGDLAIDFPNNRILISDVRSVLPKIYSVARSTTVPVVPSLLFTPTTQTLSGIAVANGNPLPVSLVSFTAKAEANHTVALDWVTSFETNNKGFLIERSKDLLRFETVGEVSELSSESKALKAYHFVDQTPYQGTSYYRLTQTDLSGKTTVFPAVSVVLRDEAYGVYPNPVINDGRFTLRLDEPETATIRFNSVDGRSVPFQKQGMQAGNLLLRATEKLSTGVYLLTVDERSQRRQYRIVVE
ncbi:T9SS type A sorting domain-containing protein [Spirosoma sp.]|uniref:T9SS type A sorting domain-containing protein n=1 Tax=Spirosoma sp. TaxID=1899569 RepID=UPI0026157FE2|nr:T9SS type A sorting domain-containing protein [Spirosoma sp.]MCX6217264.1 T9SS type A sorting domain-containing protein [Spirosoma sp.]